MARMRALLGRLGFAAFGGQLRTGGGGGEPPPEGSDGQWDFSNANQSGHLLTAGF
jgi:hypothetical protein